ncbi:MAG: hypothetical protein J6386_13745 [Candidatus Synoicihabitans palmerolidicus]|nr:hypothetical protein [Candidatus Synoicihabitans palmerolidicus]
MPRSPFMPPAGPEAPAAPKVEEDAQLQFCGIFGDGASKLFCVYNVSKNRSAWLMVEFEVGPDELVIEAYDATENTVRVRQAGRTVVLALQVTKLAGGGARPVMAANLSNRSGNSWVNTVKTNPTPAR